MGTDIFFLAVAAVVLGNALCGILIYGAWRATKIEKHLGVKNGGDFLPFPLLIGMILAPGLVAWAGWYLSSLGG